MWQKPPEYSSSQKPEKQKKPGFSTALERMGVPEYREPDTSHDMWLVEHDRYCQLFQLHAQQENCAPEKQKAYPCHQGRHRRQPHDIPPG